MSTVKINEYVYEIRFSTYPVYPPLPKEILDKLLLNDRFPVKHGAVRPIYHITTRKLVGYAQTVPIWVTEEQARTIESKYWYLLHD